MKQLCPLLVLVAPLLGACASGNSGAAPSDAATQEDGAPGDETPRTWNNFAPPACGDGVTGSADVWLEDVSRMELVNRPLPCLSGNGKLEGTFVVKIEPSSGLPAEQVDNRFSYSIDDDHLQEVQAYFSIVGMAGHLQPFGFALPPVRVRLVKDTSAVLDYYSPTDHEIMMGLASTKPAMVPLQILNHEYAHHIVFQYLPPPKRLDPVLSEALADYLAADFSGEPAVISMQRFDVPSSVLGDVELMQLARRYFERSVANSYREPEDAIRIKEQCDVVVLAAPLLGASFGLSPQLAFCKTASSTALAAPAPHLVGRIVAGALWDARIELGSKVVNTLIFAVLAKRSPISNYHKFAAHVLNADVDVFSSEHVDSLTRIFTARGLL